MAQNELLDVKTIQFYNSTQFLTWSDFFAWYSNNKDIVILTVADDSTETDHQVTVFYELL